MNYERDIQIDETALDVEWLEQPRLMLKYCQVAAEARRALDKAKEALDLKKAELDRDIRSDPEKYSIEKITDKVVENTIPLQEAYATVSTAYLEAKFELEIAQGAVRAFDARKDALENLVRLHGQQYFAGPKVPRDLTKERVDRESRTTNINAAIGRRIRK